jgi:hypothetical protein
MSCIPNEHIETKYVLRAVIIKYHVKDLTEFLKEQCYCLLKIVAF